MSQTSNPSVTSLSVDKPDDGLKETAFIDQDADIHDPILSTHSMYEAIRLVLENSAASNDILNLYSSNLCRVVVPQTFNFLELVHWCVEHYLPEKRAVISSDGRKVVCYLAPLNIALCLLLTDPGEMRQLTEAFLVEKYHGLSDDLKVKLLAHHTAEGVQLRVEPPPYPATFLSASLKIAIAMMAQVLGRKTDVFLDEAILGFLASISPLECVRFIKFDYAKFLSDAIHQQIVDFPALKTFRYQSFLLHSIIQNNYSHLEPLEIRLVDEIHVPLPVIEWLPIVRKPPDNKRFRMYVNTFAKLVHCLIYGSILPRIPPSIRNVLQLSPDMRMGDWFLHQFYTVIKVYDFEGEPYMLPEFLTDRIFALEY